MKTSAVSVAVFVAIVVSSWFIVGHAQEELAAPDRAVVQLRVPIDAIRFRPGEGFSRFLAPRGTDLARGKLARKLLEQHRAGDTLWLVGTFDFGRVGHVRFPRDVTIRGLGPGRTRLQNAWTEAAVACAFELADGVLLEDLTIESTCRTDEQQVLVGYAGTVSNAHATIRGCDIFGKAWAVYAWATGSDNYLTLEDCRIKSGRQCVSACGSNPTSQFVDVRHCLLEVDPGRSTYDGAVAADRFEVEVQGYEDHGQDDRESRHVAERRRRAFGVIPAAHDGQNEGHSQVAGAAHDRHQESAAVGEALRCDAEHEGPEIRFADAEDGGRGETSARPRGHSARPTLRASYAGIGEQPRFEGRT